MESKKSNRVESIYIPLPNGTAYKDVFLNIPFPVKRIKVVSSHLKSDDHSFVGGYLASNIPNASILATIEDISDVAGVSFSGIKNESSSLEYIFDQSISISGNYRFTLYNMAGDLFTNDTDYIAQDYAIRLVIDFRQE